MIPQHKGRNGLPLETPREYYDKAAKRRARIDLMLAGLVVVGMVWVLWVLA